MNASRTFFRWLHAIVGACAIALSASVLATDKDSDYLKTDEHGRSIMP